MSKKIIIILCCLCLFFIEKSAAQETSSFENKVRTLMKEKKVPGISIAIIENTEIASHLEFGVKNSKTNDPIEDNTLFEAASLSKPVFAYGVLQLVEKGQLNLDKPLVEYFSYPDVNNDERFKLITARMILSHTAGFPNWRPKNELLKIHFCPGERFSYSGEGFVYLQKVVERLSGLPLEEYIKKNVFMPLGMNHSTFIWLNDEKLKASGHDSNGLPIENLKGISPNAAYTLHTTVLDYAKFVIAIMKGIGLQSGTINEMLSPQIRVQEGYITCLDHCSHPLSDSVSWGLGWGLQSTCLGDSFWHWGDNDGFKSFVVGFKKRQ